MNYEGLICDGCGLEMHEGEDIVVCPVCGTPQHRECYKLNNRCVNEHLHSENFEFKAPEQPKDENVDVQDKQPDTTSNVNMNGNTSPFVPLGAENAQQIFMRGVLYDPNDEFDSVKVGEAATFVQQGSARYINRFMKSKKSGRKLTWNWAAFFFTPFWFFYRKMYKIGTVMLLISIAISSFTSFYQDRMFDKNPAVYAAFTEFEDQFERSQEIGNFQPEKLQATMQEVAKQSAKHGHVLEKYFILIASLTVLQSIAAALIADYFYKKKLSKTVELARENTDEKAKSFVLIKNGGVSFLAALASIAASSIIPMLIYSIAELL